MKIKMLIFRSAIVDKHPNDDNNIKNINDVTELDKVKELIKYNKNDITAIRHNTKKLNGAFLPELIYKSDSNIQIERSCLIKILKLENKLKFQKILSVILKS